MTDRPDTVSLTFLTDFLISIWPDLKKVEAQRMAHGLMLKLLDLPGVESTCTECNLARGECRCPAHGYDAHGKWEYARHAAHWVCTSASIAGLSPDVALTLSPAMRQSVRRLVMYLRGPKRR